jgi:hypothetical protein
VIEVLAGRPRLPGGALPQTMLRDAHQILEQRDALRVHALEVGGHGAAGARTIPVTHMRPHGGVRCPELVARGADVHALHRGARRELDRLGARPRSAGHHHPPGRPQHLRQPLDGGPPADDQGRLRLHLDALTRVCHATRSSLVRFGRAPAPRPASDCAYASVSAYRPRRGMLA